MMKNNVWYQIAHTIYPEANCTINFTAGLNNIVFDVYTWFDSASIVVKSKSVSKDYMFSIRVRKHASRYCIDILSNKDIYTAPFWDIEEKTFRFHRTRFAEGHEGEVLCALAGVNVYDLTVVVNGKETVYSPAVSSQRIELTIPSADTFATKEEVEELRDSLSNIPQWIDIND